MGHTLHSHQGHYGWDNSLTPAITVAPGESIEFEVKDASDGHLGANSTAQDLLTLDFATVNPVTGPVFIDGAEPGDALIVTILDLVPSGWGWTGNIPGFGILADQFPDPALHLWNYDAKGMTPAAFGANAKIPLRAFPGTVGVAPAEPGHHSIVPPRNVGGNMDVRDLFTGTKLTLPIEVEGALFSVGDTHAAQGDGEVCGTAIESAMSVALKFELVKGAAAKFPHYETAGPVTRHLDEKGYFVTTGVGPDLMQNARDAVSGMVDFLGREQGLSAIDAYMLCSVCADMRIGEIVDQPNFIVGMYFPKVVFD